MNHDLAGYEVPMHADIQRQEVILLDETDPVSESVYLDSVGLIDLMVQGFDFLNQLLSVCATRLFKFG